MKIDHANHVDRATNAIDARTNPRLISISTNLEGQRDYSSVAKDLEMLERKYRGHLKGAIEGNERRARFCTISFSSYGVALCIYHQDKKLPLNHDWISNDILAKYIRFEFSYPQAKLKRH